MYRNVDKEPVGFEKWIFKWIFAPLIVISLLVMRMNISSERSHCESICKDKGFPSFRYTPPGKYGIGGNTCDCLTADEAALKNQIPKGVRAY